jgi:UDP-N-acetylglucosamine 2-epimerase (non-hydrolysing)/GDP/UDP-N,N'-diacetylbacillosamine 2-epimerase (hydrolysing)
MRRICVVTVARSDYGIFRPLLRRICQTPDLELALVAAGMHLAPEFGNTIDEIRADGLEIALSVDLSLSSDRPGSIARSMGLGTIGFAQAYEWLRPDILVVLGDRFEMQAAALAAVPFLMPIAHIAGGALSGGAIDDAFRHAITKLSNLHFVETEPYARRVVQMGEEPWRVHMTGALGLDNLREVQPMPLDELNRRFDLELSADNPPLLVTFHPVTREYAETGRYMETLLAALAACDRPLVFTYPNADTSGRMVIEMIEGFVRQCPRACCVPHFGTAGYYGLMAQAAAMVGNSSSGIVEAASFKLPVVNVGTRQLGRLAPDNVLATGYERDEILDAIRKVTTPEFRDGLRTLVNPYGDGRAAERMVEVLRSIELGTSRLIQKTFHDLGPAVP